MPQRFSQLTLTPAVRELQSVTYGRTQDAVAPPLPPDVLRPREMEFVAERDSFYLATVTADGWPYVQHRGGPAGFLRVLDDRTLGFADYAGNRQLLSAGNVRGNDRVALFLMDYAGRRRLKVLGHAEFLPPSADPALTSAVAPPGQVPAEAVVERVVRIRIEAFDWNCPQHITQRFSADEVAAHVAALKARIAALERQVG